MPEVVRTDVTTLLAECGFNQLDDAGSVETALRCLAVRLNAQSADALSRSVARGEAIRHLKVAGIEQPGRLLDAAIGGPAISFATDDDEQWEWPVDGADLLDMLVDVFTRYVVLPTGAAVALALWTMHTYCLDAAEVSPILNAQSAVKRCGKTTLLIVAGALAYRALSTSSITPAALFRAIDMFHPTLFIDEADTQLPRNEDLRGVLNAGHTRQTARVIRAVPVEGGYEPREFSVWSTKLVAGIGKLPETVADRSIRILLRRRTMTERVERLRQDRIRDEVAPLRSMAARWAKDHLMQLRSADPDMPPRLNDRACDNWRPLVAIADEIGGEWPDRVRTAALLLSVNDDDDKAEPAVMLLQDLRGLFDSSKEVRLSTETILAALHALEERPWPEWHDGKSLSAMQLAKLLKPFDIRPKEFRRGDKVVRGYGRSQFCDAWTRYLAEEAATPATADDSGATDDDVARVAAAGGDEQTRWRSEP